MAAPAFAVIGYILFGLGSAPTVAGWLGDVMSFQEDAKIYISDYASACTQLDSAVAVAVSKWGKATQVAALVAADKKLCDDAAIAKSGGLVGDVQLGADVVAALTDLGFVVISGSASTSSLGRSIGGGHTNTTAASTSGKK